MPKTVIKIIQKIQKKLLLGWGKQDRGITWVKWDKACKFVQESWLGIKDLNFFNKALLGK